MGSRTLLVCGSRTDPYAICQVSSPDGFRKRMYSHGVLPCEYILFRIIFCRFRAFFQEPAYFHLTQPPRPHRLRPPVLTGPSSSLLRHTRTMSPVKPQWP
jgi:hypothetical protein